MKLAKATIVLTGATGGIGRALAIALAERGARLILSARQAEALDALAAELRARDAEVRTIRADLALPEGGTRLGGDCLEQGVPDAVIHCAGVMQFGAFDAADQALVDRLLQVNTVSAMELTRRLLPAMRTRGSGRLIFVGSVFGSIGFPMYAAYSASKFALRGFAEALRRELDGSGVAVTYVAPRYTETALNDGGPAQAAEALKLARDTPETVALGIVAAMERDRSWRAFGFAERIFMKLNALFPRLVDRALRGQTRRLQAIARSPVSITE
jgi:short-subunit dehydrogenase